MPIDPAKLRLWWWRRQGLDGSLNGQGAAEILARIGWARSVGGAGPYLALFARAGLSRAAIDQALARREIHELPAARGCTYIVPAGDYGLALAVGERFVAAEQALALKLGVTEAELDRLADRVVGALGAGPLDIEAIKEATGDAVRNLGEAGRKKGITTTLPVTLGMLEAKGFVRRIPINGRIDQLRYFYALWPQNPRAAAALEPEAASLQLAQRFFRWIGPARIAELQWFTGLGAKTCRELAQSLRLVSLASDGDLLILPEDIDAFTTLSETAEPSYALVSMIDPLLATRRKVDELIDAVDVGFGLDAGNRTAPGAADELLSHPILDRGRIIGYWAYDPDAAELVWAGFAGDDAALREAVAATEAFARDQLGDVRSFSLDSPKSRVPKLAALRQLAAPGAARL
jgi:Winged helix DNA-binding domain